MIFDIPADVAYIGGVWCEGVLYGFHILLFGAVWNTLLRRSRGNGGGILSRVLLVFSTCMFIISTAHVSIALHELLEGFIYENEVPPSVFFRINIFPARKALYIINTLLGDSLLVWRVYVVWGGNWKVTSVPALFCLGTVVCGLKTIVANCITPAESVFTSDLLSWVTSTFVLTITTQITTTLLIAGRIYYVSYASAVGNQAKARYMPLVWTIVESGAVYTSAALIQLVTYLLHMNAGVILELMLAQLSAMVPFLIVVRPQDGPTIKKDEGEMTTFRVRSSVSEEDESVTLGGGFSEREKKEHTGGSHSSVNSRRFVEV